MTKKIKGWNPTCERFVAFLDIMGFKNLVDRNSHEKVKKKLESLLPTLSSIKETAKNELKMDSITLSDEGSIFVPSAAYPVTFSDSIVLFSFDGSRLSAQRLFLYVELILLVAIDAKIPLKGAIAYGKMTADVEKDSSFYFGKPLIDAYELQKELLLYGVVLHHTSEQRLLKIGVLKKLKNMHLFEYHVPMKHNKISHHILDWTRFLSEEKESLRMISNLYNYVSGKPRIYVDNTIEFIQWILTRKAELSKKKKY
jgi:hypothetical protein